MKTKEDVKLSVSMFIGMVIFVALARVITPPYIGHPVPFSPTTAVLLTGGAYFGSRGAKWLLSLLVVLLSVWLSDIFINRVYLGQWVLFYPGFYWQYGYFVLVALMGRMLANVTIFKVVVAGLSSSLLFFIISNFGVWLTGLLYPLTQEGLLACYIAAIPFFKYSLIGNLAYCMLLFGVIERFLKRSVFSLRRVEVIG